jgi:hypothetical protein
MHTQFQVYCRKKGKGKAKDTASEHFSKNVDLFAQKDLDLGKGHHRLSNMTLQNTQLINRKNIYNAACEMLGAKIM